MIPVLEKLGDPVPGPYNRVKTVPPHVAKFVKEENAKREKYAAEAARKPAPLKRPKKVEE